MLLKRFSLLFLSLLLLCFFIQTLTAEGSLGPGSLTGWAWSSNVGWISFNCSDQKVCNTSNYAVNVDTAGNLSGYAWSSSIGWISFNAADVKDCPGGGSCTPKLNADGTLTGWAMALSGAGRTDGWNGWISLSGNNYGAVLNTATNVFGGFIWGSDVVGWIHFQQVLYTPTPAVNVLSCTGFDNQNFTITWSATGGSGTYSWYSGSQQVQLGTGTRIDVSYGTAGNQSITVKDGVRSFTCIQSVSSGGTGGTGTGGSNPSCQNGTINPPTCTIDSNKKCLNGGSNPPQCTVKLKIIPF